MKEFWHLPNRFSTSPYRMSYFCRVSPLLAEGFLSTFRFKSSFSVQSLLSSLPLSLSSLPPSFLPPFQQSHRLLHSATQALFRHTGTHTHFLRHFSTTLRRSKTNTQMDRKTGQGQAPRQPRRARAAGKNEQGKQKREMFSGKVPFRGLLTTRHCAQ